MLGVRKVGREGISSQEPAALETRLVGSSLMQREQIVHDCMHSPSAWVPAL